MKNSYSLYGMAARMVLRHHCRDDSRGYQNDFITMISCYPGSHYVILCCPDNHITTNDTGFDAL